MREHSATMSFLSSQPNPAIAFLTDSASSFAMYSLSERLCSCSLAAHSERAAASSAASVRAATMESMKAGMFNDVSCALCVSSDRVKPVGRFAAQRAASTASIRCLEAQVRRVQLYPGEG